MTIKVSIVDDHPVVTEGLQRILAGCEGIVLQGVYTSGNDLIAGLKEDPPDVLLMDIQMPGIHGVELLHFIRRDYPGVVVIALTNLDQPAVLQEILHTGAMGYVLKSAGKDVLYQAIKEVCSGMQYVDPRMKEIVYNEAIDVKKKSASSPVLTQREKEVLRLIVDGHTNQQIAEMLFLSQRTVEHHRVNIMFKLDVKNTASMVREAIVMKLLD